MKHFDFPISESDFIHYFSNEHIIGAIHIFIKKLLQDQITVDFTYLPCDHLYCITEKQFKDAFANNRSLQREKQLDSIIEIKQEVVRNIEITT